METTLIRGFVLFLALTGFGASTKVSSNVATPHANVKSGSPAPLCAPSSGNVCGMD